MPTNTTNKKPWLWLAFSMLIILIDQISKYWVSHSLTYGQPVAIMPSINFTLSHNTGAAFGFLNSHSGWQIILFSAIAVIMSVIIVRWLWQLKPNQNLSALGLSLVLGGAIGNLIDRILHGYVVDFIAFYIKDWHFAIFNFADSAITIGAFFIILDMLLQKKPA